GLRLHQRPEAERAVHQARSPGRPDDGLIGHSAAEYLHPDTDGHVPDDGRQPEVVLRLARMGARATQEPDRQRLRDVLAALAYLLPLARPRAIFRRGGPGPGPRGPNRCKCGISCLALGLATAGCATPEGDMSIASPRRRWSRCCTARGRRPG